MNLVVILVEINFQIFDSIAEYLHLHKILRFRLDHDSCEETFLSFNNFIALCAKRLLTGAAVDSAIVVDVDVGMLMLVWK